MGNSNTINRLPFNKPFIAGRELYNIAEAVLKNQHLSGDGNFTHLCQDWLVQHIGGVKAMLTHSCTGALEMSAILANITTGDEIILPSFTFVSTANAFVLRGGVPVFVDIRKDTLNIDEAKIEAAITSKTKAIVPVHYAGVPCAMNKIMEIARRHNLLVIEDAAQALLSSYEGKRLGAIGDLGCFSFHETKNIITGEGGALLINNPIFSERAEIIWEKGTNRKKFFRGEVDKYTWVDIGSSFLPSELTAAFLAAQFERAHEIIAKRKRLFMLYIDLLKGVVERIASPNTEEDVNGHLFYLITNSLDERHRLITWLADHGISSVFHYVPLHSSPAGRRLGRVSGDMRVTDEMGERLLRLPLFYEMTEQDVERVCSLVLQFYQKNNAKFKT